VFLPKKGKKSRRKSRAGPAGGGGGFRGRARGFARKAKSFLSGIDLLEALLFGAAGYFLRNGVKDSGIAAFMYNKSPAYHAAVDSLWNAGNTKAAGDYGAGMLAKAGGLGGLSYSLYKAVDGGMTKGVKNALLPFSLGALADPPESNGNGSSGGYW